MKTATSLATMLIVCMLTATAWAYELEGVDIPDRSSVTADGPDLQLNGAGVRSKFFFDIYLAGLYLATPNDNFAAIIQDPGPKRILMHFVYEEVSKEKLDAAWLDGFRGNLPESEYIRLQPRIEQFSAMFGSAHRGDRFWLDYLPGSGTRVTINDREMGLVPGEDFYQALLAIWLGDKPVTGSLKKALLGLE